MTVASASIINNYFESKPLTPEHIQIIIDSVPILEHLDVQLTEKFYKRLLKQNPEFKPFFNETHQKLLRQPRIMIHFLIQYAKNIQDLTPMIDFIKKIASKHVGLQVKPEHYPKFGQVLINVIINLFPKQLVHDEFIEAWTLAYQNLANLLIKLESEQYVEKPWYGFKQFKVTRLQRECSDVKSLYITPVDGSPIPKPKRGQYLCMRWLLPGEKHEITREYSISEYPKNNEYRITVRYIPGGKVSNYIHNNINVGDIVYSGPPCGDCVYESSLKNLVFLAGGNGVTALLPMIEAGLTEGRQVKLLYSNRSTDSRSFGKLFQSYKLQYGDRFQVVEFLSRGRTIDPIDKFYRRSLTLEDLDFIVPEDDVYLIGPRTYMKMIEDYLKDRNITVKLDYFGPREI